MVPIDPVRQACVPRPALGALFDLTSDAVVLFESSRVVAWNGRAEVAFGVTSDLAAAGAPTPLDPHLPALLALPEGGPHLLETDAHGAFEVTRRVLDGHDLLLLRDVSVTRRRQQGLSRLAALSQVLLAQPLTVAETIQSLTGEAKHLTGAAYSALLLLREGSSTESSHFVYDAPRHLFPSRMPRAVGLLAVPIATRRAARLDDIRGHPAGVGLPGVHPPMGPLIAVPLLAGDQVLGELAVANPPEGRVFDELDESLLVDLAAYAAVAVRWAQAAEATREQALLRQEIVDTARHDIRTPLGAGKGYTHLLSTKLERMSPAQVATALDGLGQAFARIESFTARLLVDERLDVVGAEPQWDVVEIAPLLEQLRRDAAVTTGRTGAVALQHEPDAPTTLAGDPEMVRQVLDNLVGNALKHVGDAGPVTVTVRSEGDYVRLDVRDLGPGIAEADQAELFERWTRTAASQAALVPGFGLGLSIVRRLVVAHGGLLGVSSRLGEGATFWVTFPSAPPESS